MVFNNGNHTTQSYLLKHVAAVNKEKEKGCRNYYLWLRCECALENRTSHPTKRE